MHLIEPSAAQAAQPFSGSGFLGSNTVANTVETVIYFAVLILL